MHPLSQYIEPCDLAKSQDDQAVYEFFNNDIIMLEPFLTVPDFNAVRFVTTHAPPGFPIDCECRDFIRKRVSLKTDINLQLQAITSELGLDRYCVVHLRMGDHTFGAAISPVPAVESYLREVIVPKWGRNVLLMSDNSAIKGFLSEMHSVMYIANTPVHLGQCGYKESLRDGVLDALLDFHLMARSEEIYQYSVYPWGSGFSDMCSKIYDVPLTKL